MSDLPGIAVLQIAPFDAERAMTGAHVITAQVLRGLAGHAGVTLLQGAPPDGGPARPHSPWPGLTVLAAFPLDESVARRGHVAPDLTAEGRRALDRARVLLTMERTVALPVTVPRVACLGGLGYSHSFEVVDGGGWDLLVLPSPHARELVLRHAPGLRGVTVIENGVDLDRFAPAAPRATDGGPVRLLVPARADPIKGLVPALHLARALAADGRRVELSCLDENGLCGRGTLYDDLLAEAGDVDMRLISWRSRGEMPATYRDADLTVCFSGLPEGFGLAALESVACGTPVLAWPAGFLADMFPPGHGLYLVDPEAPAEAWAETARRALAEGSGLCRARGVPYARRRYDARRMVSEYRDLILGLACSSR